jgi:voltage-gated potassium channel Kch
MNRIYQFSKKIWAKDRSFSFLLIVLTVYIFVVIPFLVENHFSKFLFLFFYYALLTSSINYLLNKNQHIILMVLVFFPFLFLLLELYFDSTWIEVFTDFFIVIYCLVLCYVILTKTFAKGKIDVRRVQGAVIVYLLSGLIFCLIYHIIFKLSPVKSFSVVPGSLRKEFLYFSFVTLTTVGYGDIVPLTPISRSMANLEALIGQLYPAILIARLVSMEISEKRSDHGHD